MKRRLRHTAEERAAVVTRYRELRTTMSISDAVWTLRREKPFGKAISRASVLRWASSTVPTGLSEA